MSRAQRDRRHRASRQRHAAEHSAHHDGARRGAGSGFPVVRDRATGAGELLRSWWAKVPGVVQLAVTGAVWGLVLGRLAGATWRGVVLGVLGGATVGVRDRLAPRLGRTTATLAVGLFGAGLLVVAGLVSKVTDVVHLALLGLGGLLLPVLFVVLARLLVWTPVVVMAPLRLVRWVRRRWVLVAGTNPLFDRPVARDPLAWGTLAGLLGAVVLVTAVGAAPVWPAVVACVAPAVAGGRLARRNGRARAAAAARTRRR